MSLCRVACVLLLAAATSACGDDPQIAECQQNTNPKRQAEACTKVIRANPQFRQKIPRRSAITGGDWVCYFYYMDPNNRKEIIKIYKTVKSY